MPREALLLANHVSTGLRGKGLSIGVMRRILARFARVLIDLPDEYRFRVTQHVNAKPFDVRSQTEIIARRCSRTNDIFLLFYLGHGRLGPSLDLHLVHPFEDGGRHGALRLEMLDTAVRNADCAKSLFILDCCYAGARPWQYQSPLLGEHCCLSATTATTKAYIDTNLVEEPMGFFTRAIIDGFSSQVACTSAIDNSVTAEGLFRYAEADVRNRTNSVQRPQIYGQLRDVLTVYQPKPAIIPGVNELANDKTGYRKIMAIIEVLSGAQGTTSVEALHRRLLSRYKSVFETLYKTAANEFVYRPVSIAVTQRYLQLLRTLGLVHSFSTQLTSEGRRVGRNIRGRFNIGLLNAIEDYLKRIGMSVSDIEASLRQLLNSRSIPARVEVLDYIALVNRAVKKDDLSVILDLLGYIRAIRMSDGRSYFPW